MNPQLDECQIKAVSELKTGSILKGGVGSGKSRTALAYYFVRVCGGLINGKDLGYESDYVPMIDPIDLYIFTTARKRDEREWEKELIPFLLSPNEEYNLYYHDMKVVIDSWNNIKKYTSLKGCFVIFDEQKAIGNGTWSKSFIRIAKNNQWILLSATPGDSWIEYLPVFIANGFYSNRQEFFARHVVYSRYSKFPKIDRYLDEGHLVELRNQILVEMNYTNPTERHCNDVRVDYDRLAYRRLLHNRFNEETGRPIKSISELSYLLRKLINTDDSRIQAVLDIRNRHPKLIIFYNYNYERDILLSLDYGKNVKVKEWNGFNHDSVPDSDEWVYLVQYISGAEGWNCTKTDAMLFYSANYSYKITEQCMGRIDRRNTKYEHLYYYFLKSNAPIDRGIANALSKKRDFNEKKFFQRL